MIVKRAFFGFLFLGMAAFMPPFAIGAPETKSTPGAASSGKASPERLRELEGNLEKGRAERDRLKKRVEDLTRELEKLRKDSVAAARTAQEYESVISDQENRLEALGQMESEKTAVLSVRQRQLTGVLIALQRLAWRPPEALIAEPSDPNETVRTAILLRSITPKIEESTRELRLDLDSLRTIRAEIGAERLKRSATMGKLSSEHKRLTSMMARKAELQRQTQDQTQATEKRLQTMASEAKDLRDLMARLEEERKRRAADAAKARATRAATRTAGARSAAEPESPSVALRDISKVAGKLPYPARGRVVGSFGARDKTGSPSKGIYIETRAGAQVTLPFEGQVAFSGPFRGYGQLLIIEHSEGYHTLLAGMSRIDCWAGQTLMAGEPVGMMPEEDGKPLLYFEMRKGGQPVDPMVWLAAHKDKASG